MRVFEEFEEEKYQSVVSVPLIAKDGSVLGVVALHAEAPHDYSQRDAEFLLTSASLVAGAIENAQLHRETKRRVATLEGLFALAGAISEAETLEALLPAVTARVVPLLGVTGCEIYLLEADGERLRLRAASPGSTAPRVIGLRDVGLALAVSRTTARDERDASLSDTVVSGDGSDAPVLHAPLVVSGELLGLMIVRGGEGHRFRDGAPRPGDDRRLADGRGGEEDPAARAAVGAQPDEGLLRRPRGRRGAGRSSRAAPGGCAATSRSRAWSCGPARPAPTRPTGRPRSRRRWPSRSAAP